MLEAWSVMCFSMQNCYGEQCENVAEPEHVPDYDTDDFCDEEQLKVTNLKDLIPEDCLEFNVPWLAEEEV